MRSLFFKIFVVLWAAMSGVGALVLLVGDLGGRQLQREQWRDLTSDAFEVYAVSVAGDHDDPDVWTSAQALSDLEQRTGIRAWLFDTRGHEVSGRTARVPIPSVITPRLPALLAGTHDEHTEFLPVGNLMLAACEARLPNGHRYVLVGLLPTAQFTSWEAPLRVQALRLASIVLIAALVSWGLTRHLIGPILALRRAAQRLAEGDLAARAGTGLQGRRDELGMLARDFDTMAARLEALLAEKEALLSERERLVHLQRRLLGDVSHELRSPLARVGIAVELARDLLPAHAPTAQKPTQSAEASSIAAALDRIETEIGRLSDLIALLLMLSRLESGVQKPGNDLIDLAALVRAVAQDADFEARSKKHVTCKTPDSPQDALMVRGTPDLLRSAVENVIRNAVRYTPENTSVEVSLSAENPQEAARWSVEGMANGCFTSSPVLSLEAKESSRTTTQTSSWAVVSVRDHGPGVPQDELAEVFRPFYRVSGSRERGSGGTGLGLAITSRAIELHGGQYRAYNAPDSGLCIEIRLPLSRL